MRPVRRICSMVSEQPVAVLQHGAVKLLALVLVHGARLQRFEVQPDGGDGRLQLVRDGVDERVVLLVAADFAHQEGGVQDHAGNDHGEQQDAEKQQDAVAPIEQDPADVEEQDDEMRPTPRAMKNAIDLYGRRCRSWFQLNPLGAG